MRNVARLGQELDLPANYVDLVPDLLRGAEAVEATPLKKHQFYLILNYFQNNIASVLSEIIFQTYADVNVVTCFKRFYI